MGKGLLVASLVLLTAPAAAALDCRGSPSPTELLICRDLGLVDMHRRLVGDLNGRPMPSVVDRERCGADAPCISRWYLREIRALRAEAAKGPEPAPPR